MNLQEQAMAAFQWWAELQPDPTTRRPGNRGALARLRRCVTPLQAATEPVALDLARRVGIRDGGDPRLPAALVTAIILAHVRENDSHASAARQLGAPGENQRAPMSPLRLARLLASDSDDERLAAFRRAVALARHRINVRDLASALLDWSERTRTRWAFAYHDAPPPGMLAEAGALDPSSNPTAT